ncbi:flagellar hook assembly protein FlgD [Oxalobacteraceae bacterium OM1]|nr:flagellar hook assembly protein FlgD [Oxalobacteraceae bacterium OM1]
MATNAVQGGGAVSPELLAAMNGKKNESADAVQEQQDRFMTLLVTQMKNQDPMNPMDNAQVTTQFAQLSTVAGINKLNDTLAALQGSYATSQNLQATSMIGHGVLAPGSNIALSEGKAIFGVDFPQAVDKATVSILNESGKVVRTMQLGSNDAGSVPVVWDGKTDDDTTAPDGKYTFKVEATQGENNVKPTPLSFGSVVSVTTGSGGVKLNVPGMDPIGMSDVRQIL